MADAAISKSTASQFALWLTPAPSDRRWLFKVIQDYATEYHFPAFEPHVTIYSGLYHPKDDLAKIMRDTLGSSQPITLQITGLNYTDDFFKTGFITFAPSADLLQLSARICHHLSQPVDYRFDPHLSLIYKDIPIDQKRLAMLRFVLSVSKVTFDTVKIITPSEQGWSDIAHWKEQHRYNLAR